jgi:hypothetical protein
MGLDPATGTGTGLDSEKDWDWGWEKAWKRETERAGE